MPHIAVLGLDKNAIHHGHMQHAAQEHLVYARRIRQLGIRNIVVQRDMVGDVITVNIMKAGEVGELFMLP